MRAAVFVLACAGLFAACRVSYQPPPETALVQGLPPHAAPAGQTWLYIVPRQCLSNPWEKAWQDERPGSQYPHNPNSPGPDPAEIAIFELYYSQFGVSILETTSVVTNEVRCAACSCPADYALCVLVRDSDVSIMTDAGFRPLTPQAAARFAPQTHADSTAADE